MKKTFGFVSLVAIAAVACTSSEGGDEKNNGGDAGQSSAGGSSDGSGGSGGKGGNGGGGSAGQGSGGSSSASGGAAGMSSGGSSGKAGGSGGTASGGAAGMAAGGSGDAPAETCKNLKAKVFDFRSDHPDFQPEGAMVNALINFVKEELDADKDLQLVPGVTDSYVKDAASLKQWYRPTENVNKVIDVDLTMFKRSALLWAFGSDNPEGDWYPIDAKGWGNLDIIAPRMHKDADEATLDNAHNQLFTAKIEASFYYRGGKNELIISESDDDSWVFINGKLALDNGGLKGFAPASVNLDAVAAKLGIQPGKSYPITFFYAERNFGGARYRVSHNLVFDNCK